MNTEEAIEFVEWEKRLGEYNHNLLTAKTNKKFDEVISLLQQRESYRQICEKIDEEWGHIDITSLGVRETLSQWIDDIKQKYFPKEGD